MASKTKSKLKKNKNGYERWEFEDFRGLLAGIVERYADNTAFLWRCVEEPDGVSERTYRQFAEDVVALATFLCAKGLEGKTVAVTGKNCYGWAVSYMAVTCGCGTVLPLDKELRADELDALLADASASAILYTKEMEEKMGAVSDEAVLHLPLSSLDAYVSDGIALREAGDTSYEDHIVDPYALGVLLYTSGTMGVAKGVMLSQNNISSDIVNVCAYMGFGEEDRCLSHLPLHHTYECMADFLSMLYCGGSIAYNDGMRKLPGDFQLFQPTVLVTVPAVLEFMTRFVRKGYSEAKGGKVLLAAQKLASGVSGATVGVVSQRASKKQKRKIFSTVDNFFGGRLHTIMVGAAALSPDIYKLFESFGYIVLCGYGLTETSPISLMHSDFYRSVSDTGKPVRGVEVRIDEPDENGVGELCIKGPNVMLGYYKNEEATNEVLTDGWFHTGDLGMRLKNGAFRITGRKKSMIVSPTGKKIFPEELEAYFYKDATVNECMVYAEEKDGNQQIVVSVYPDSAEMTRVLGLSPEDPDFAAGQRAHLLGLVKSVNGLFPVYKHIRKLVIRREEFEKTTTRKIKRSAPENLEEPKDAEMPEVNASETETHA